MTDQDRLNDQLLKACESGNIVEVRRLIKAGVDVNLKDEHGNTSLHYTAWKGHTEICHILIKAGADVNTKDKGRDTPLHYAALHGYTETCRILIRAGADVNVKNKLGNTPRDIAIINKRHELAKILELYELNPELAKAIYGVINEKPA